MLQCTTSTSSESNRTALATDSALSEHFVVTNIFGYGTDDDKHPASRVNKYSSCSTELTWEPPKVMDYNIVVQYCRRKELPVREAGSCNSGKILEI